MRKVAMRIVVVLGYWLGIDRLFYFLNRQAKRIIVFHNVLPDEIMEKERTSGAIRLVCCDHSRMLEGVRFVA